MNDIDCPYCGHSYDICNDDGHGMDEDQTHHEQCPKCDKWFVFTASWSVSYWAEKADCLNGGPHVFQYTKTIPKECSRLKCTVCDERDRMAGKSPDELLAEHFPNVVRRV